MIRFRGCIVYVTEATAEVPNPGPAIRPATLVEVGDPDGPRLAVLSDGWCVPLSRFEIGLLGRPGSELTAETITDDQIRALRETFVARLYHGTWHVEMCDAALAGDVAERARCAAVLNARVP